MEAWIVAWDAIQEVYTSGEDHLIGIEKIKAKVDYVYDSQPLFQLILRVLTRQISLSRGIRIGSGSWSSLGLAGIL